MADISAAVSFVMSQGDHNTSGAITSTPSERGKMKRFGLSVRLHPELKTAGFYDMKLDNGQLTPKMDAAEALAMAKATYQGGYATPMMLDALTSQALADGMLSFAVVEGTHDAIALLQKAILAVTPVPVPKQKWPFEFPSPVLTVDGVMNSAMVSLANAADQAQLLNAFVEFTGAHFRHVGTEIPSQAGFVDGWINQANAVLTLS